MIGWLVLLVAAPPGAIARPAVSIDASRQISESRVDAVRSACEEITRKLGAPQRPWKLELKQSTSPEEFQRATGRARFEAAASSGSVIWLQSEAILSRHDTPAILRHECAHAWLRARGLPPLPRVIEEALAVRLSGQAAKLPPAPRVAATELVRLEKILAAPKDARQLEGAVARAAATLGPRLELAMRRGNLVATLRTWSAIRVWDAKAWTEVVKSSQ